MSLYHFPSARSEEQLRYMEELEARGICIFCPENFAEYHREPIEDEGQHWVVTKNDHPYVGALVHLLVVPRLHVASLDQLPDAAGAELFRVVKRIKDRYHPRSEALIARSGDMRLNGGSVEHLHFHFIVGDTENPEHQPIRFKISTRDRSKGPDVKNPPSSL